MCIDPRARATRGPAVLRYLLRMSPTRRDFQKSAPVAAGALSLVTDTSTPHPATPEPAITASATRIGGAAYTPRRDYPIQPQKTVTRTDSFWRPRVERNARGTIPFEIEKLTV